MKHALVFLVLLYCVNVAWAVDYRELSPLSRMRFFRSMEHEYQSPDNQKMAIELLKCESYQVRCDWDASAFRDMTLWDKYYADLLKYVSQIPTEEALDVLTAHGVYDGPDGSEILVQKGGIVIDRLHKEILVHHDDAEEASLLSIFIEMVQHNISQEDKAKIQKILIYEETTESDPITRGIIFNGFLTLGDDIALQKAKEMMEKAGKREKAFLEESCHTPNPSDSPCASWLLPKMKANASHL